MFQPWEGQTLSNFPPFILFVTFLCKFACLGHIESNASQGDSKKCNCDSYAQ